MSDGWAGMRLRCVDGGMTTIFLLTMQAIRTRYAIEHLGHVIMPVQSRCGTLIDLKITVLKRLGIPGVIV